MKSLTFDEFFGNLINIANDQSISITNSNNQDFLKDLKIITQHELTYMNEKDLIGSYALFPFKDNSDSITEFMWVIIRRISIGRDGFTRVIGVLLNNSYINNKYKYGNIISRLKEDIIDICKNKPELEN